MGQAFEAAGGEVFLDKAHLFTQQTFIETCGILDFALGNGGKLDRSVQIGEP